MTDPRKLKSTQVKSTRQAMLESQGYACAICKLPVEEDQAVLDHCHKGGHVRAVLHRGCNAVEGKIVNAMKRYGVKNPVDFLRNLADYHVYHAENRTGLIHPTHKTEDEKKELAKKRAKRKKLQKKNAAAE